MLTRYNIYLNNFKNDSRIEIKRYRKYINLAFIEYLLVKIKRSKCSKCSKIRIQFLQVEIFLTI